MPRKSKAEVIADLEAKLAEARASEDKSKTTKVEKLRAEAKTIRERITALEIKEQAKLDEANLIDREISEAAVATPADVSVSA